MKPLPLDLHVYCSITVWLCIDVYDIRSKNALYDDVSVVEYFLLQGYQAF
jgi:hypothetical protein